jgi:DNA-binding GntR family transcriptional regulator
MIQLIDREPDLRLARGRQVISAQAAWSEVARKFGVGVGTPILLVERDLQSASGRTVAYSRFHHLGHPQSVRVGQVSR